ncbi:pyruvate kinase (plasmid) [Cupriavidus sp. P-10]|uniref:pyruvate kinase n=1 Tax=unclassified Cupriavidus TaxID=2640874 RepID=UPI000E2F7602|nr:MULTISPECIES: pyruvate kinase [unclassified Cupriavidus]BDB29643.1 pyruvate kinase [Cupriavidus sp. P-10]
MHRKRSAKIVATLGPSSSDLTTVRALFEAGADVFRLNFSHGTHAQHQERLEIIRHVERETGRPIAVLLDLQGPKLRIGALANGPATLQTGAAFRLDLDPAPGDATRAPLPHPEIFAALKTGTELLIDDGKVRLKVERCGPDFADTQVITGGTVSDRKGVNVPSVLLPISAMTPKDRADLEFGLTLGVDWIALSFVQRPEDLHEAKAIVQGRAAVLAKLEKPAAIESLDAIIEAADAIMVARGDLGVELPAEQVPRIQKRIVRACRATGKPVIVATQMLESMITSPVPTRAEASDVANAVYDGADAVMLSAESASGKHPREAVVMMDRIIAEVESDPDYRNAIDASHTAPQAAVADAICLALRQSASLLPVTAMVTYTRSGYTSLRAARERPVVPVLSMTPDLATARRLALVWGVHSVHADDSILDVPDMVNQACAMARREAFAEAGDTIAIASGMPFGVAGTTNFLHIAKA